MSAPMTAGIAYGRKTIRRANRVNHVVTASRTSAIPSEMSIWSGMSTIENLITNQTPLRKCSSVKAFR